MRKSLFVLSVFVWLSTALAYSVDYFSITALAAGAKVSMSVVGSGVDKPSMQCSTDGGSTWTVFTPGTSSVTLYAVGDQVLFRGTNPQGFNLAYDKGYKFTATANISVGGNIMTLVDGDTPGNDIKAEGCFANLFNGCTKLISIVDLQLPTGRTSAFCYYRMFYGCTALTVAFDRLQAATIADNACKEMFRGCSVLKQSVGITTDTIGESGCENMFFSCVALTQAKDISVKVIGLKGCSAMFSSCRQLTTAARLSDVVSIGERGCFSMFISCTGITSSPALVASAIGEFAYGRMFHMCTALTAAPLMQATVVGKYGCFEMYLGCKVLTSSPDLMAPNVSNNAYQNMFYGCSALTTAPYIAAKVIGISTCCNMFYQCKSLTLAQEVLPAVTVSDSGCYAMFSSCTSLTRAIDMPNTKVIGNSGCQFMYEGCTKLTDGATVLAATRVMDYGYRDMFYNCSTMTSTAAVLPATIIGHYAYASMYRGCTVLTSAPEIAATSMGVNAMQQMFASCKALTKAPSVLPAMTATRYCYANMFTGCTSLTLAPQLPATTLADYCYNAMFNGCTALTQAPVLPALSLTYNNNGVKTNYAGCYSRMFYGCRNLNRVEVHFSEWGEGAGSNSDTSDKYPTNRWMDGVTGKGVFRAPCELTEKHSTHEIPANFEFQCMVRAWFDVRTTGGSWDGKDAVGQLLVLPLDQMPQAQKDGCLFTGWNTKAEGTGDSFDLTSQPSVSQTFYAQFQPIDFDIVDWQEKNIIVRTTATNISTVNLIVRGGESLNVNSSLSNREIDNPGVYALSFDKTDVFDHAGGYMSLELYDAAHLWLGTMSVPIPFIVEGTTDVSVLKDTKETDIWVQPDGVLTFDVDKECGDLYVCGGAKVVVPAGQQVVANRVVLRGGRLEANGTYTYSAPQLVVNGSLRNNASLIDYEYLVSEEKYYSLTLPCRVNVKDVVYLNGEQAQIVINRYNGMTRTTGQTGWESYWNPFVGSTAYPSLEVGTGYIIYGVPPTIRMEGATHEQKRRYCYLRFPMQTNLMLGEKATDSQKTVAVSPYGITANTLQAGVRPNDAGWNLVGNPFLADYSGLNSLSGNSIIGLLEMQDGEYQWVGNQRYVVIPSDDGRSYTPVLASAASLPAFKNFFVQIGTGDALTFSLANRVQYAPQRAEQEQMMTGVTIENESETDEVGLLLGDDYTPDYDFNADLAKWHNQGLNMYLSVGGYQLSVAAVEKADAEEWMPLVVSIAYAGDYTFRLSDMFALNNEPLYLFDKNEKKILDLTQEQYICSLNKGIYPNRFFVSVQRPEMPTGLDYISANGKVDIYTLTGKKIYTGQALDYNILPRGIYICVYEGINESKTTKIIIP